MPTRAAVESELLGDYGLLAVANPSAYDGASPLPALDGPIRDALAKAGGTVAEFGSPTDDELATLPAGKGRLFRLLLAYYAFDSAAGSYADVDTTAAGVARYSDQVYPRLVDKIALLRARVAELDPTILATNRPVIGRIATFPVGGRCRRGGEF